MNVNEIATFVCNKLNKPELLAIAKTFVTREYEFVYDSYNWRDVEYTYLDTLPASQQLLPLNATAGRVASVTVNGKQIDPVNAVLLTQIDPTIFSRTGEPELYEEYYNPGDQSRNIKFYPIPTASTAILVVAIRKIAAMSGDSDVSAIRNIDNVLIQFVEADMLERLKSYATAKEKRQEAMAALAEAQKLDQQERTNIPRQIKPMTVGGDTLAEMLDACSAITGHWAPEDRVLMREYYRRNYMNVYDSQLWRESQFAKTMTSTFGTQIIMHPDVGEVMAVAREGKTYSLEYQAYSRFWEFDPTMLNNVGEPLSFTVLTPVGIDQESPTAETFSIVSTNAADQGKVFVRGTLQGYELEEYLQLNGTTPVSTTFNYDRVLVLSKKQTLGDVTATSNVSNTVLVSLNYFETGHINQVIRLNPGYQDPDSGLESVTLVILGKRKINPLVQDEDRPIVSGFGNILIYLTAAQIFSKYGDDKSATNYSNQAAMALKNKISKETQQGANSSVVIPYTEAPALDLD